MLEAKEVVKSFDGFRALDGLTMSVEGGSIYGLVGPNGAGKSTILRHITGIYRPDSCSVRVDGQPVYENPAVKSRMAWIPDELYYFLSASTRDMMKFYRGLYPQFDDKRYQTLKDAFPAVDEKQPIRRLSKGMQKQSAFWLSLCCRPDLLVLDELCSAVSTGMVPLELVTAFLDRRPAELEVVITGRDPAAELERRADYITEMKKIRHPFDKGVAARKGIEW